MLRNNEQRNADHTGRYPDVETGHGHDIEDWYGLRSRRRPLLYSACHRDIRVRGRLVQSSPSFLYVLES